LYYAGTKVAQQLLFGWMGSNQNIPVDDLMPLVMAVYALDDMDQGVNLLVIGRIEKLRCHVTLLEGVKLRGSVKRLAELCAAEKQMLAYATLDPKSVLAAAALHHTGEHPALTRTSLLAPRQDFWRRVRKAVEPLGLIDRVADN